VPCRRGATISINDEAASPTVLPGIELLRRLGEYEQVAGGG